MCMRISLEDFMDSTNKILTKQFEEEFELISYNMYVRLTIWTMYRFSMFTTSSGQLSLAKLR